MADTIAPGMHAVLYLELQLDGRAPPDSLEGERTTARLLVVLRRAARAIAPQ